MILRNELFGKVLDVYSDRFHLVDEDKIQYLVKYYVFQCIFY